MIGNELEESIMTASYTFDIVSSLDGFGSYSGGGWGGCVVALTEPGAVEVDDFDPAWLVRPSAGARLVTDE